MHEEGNINYYHNMISYRVESLMVESLTNESLMVESLTNESLMVELLANESHHLKMNSLSMNRLGSNH